MKFLNSLFFCLSGIIIIPYTYGRLPSADSTLVFDRDLYESVLDPELCQKQLEYLRNNDTFLRLQFREAGVKIPRGILNGNLRDFGNYRQCLSLSREVEDMTIQGKYCNINLRVPLNFNAEMAKEYAFMGFDLEELRFNEEYIRVLDQINNEKSQIQAREGIDLNWDSVSRNGPSISFNLAVCLPQVCTTRDAINIPFFNLSTIGFQIEERSCRLPNDKPLVTADYIAWVIVSLLGLITILSTIYDVRHTIILKKDPKEASELLSAFSVHRNTTKLVKISSRPGLLECLDGIRALSTMWVVVGHSFMNAIMVTANPFEVFNWYASLGAIWFKTAPLAVDTFFLLSGLLVVYTTAKKLTTKQLAKNLHVFYLQRILRMFPILAAVILFRTSFYNHMGDGPSWGGVARDVQSCRTYWWVTLLHLQNFLTPLNGCIPETWYLAIDVQLHILSPLVLLWVLYGAKRPAWTALTSGFLISLTAATTYIFVKNLAHPEVDSFTLYYFNILTRAPPFFVGMIFGYLLHLWREDKCGLNKTIGNLITIFALGMLALILYTEHIHIHGNTSVTLDNVFMSFIKTSWVITIGWIIFACVNGYAGPINWFLSLSVWKIPSRISYSMYLIHMSLMNVHFASVLQPIYFTLGFYMFDFLAFLYMTMFIAFFMTALIDAPFATLFRLLLQIGSNKPKNEELKKTARISEGKLEKTI